MKRPTGRLIGEQDAPGVVGDMTARIPPTLGKIQSAHERHGIVDEDHFLMVRCAHRMGTVLVEMESAMRGELRGKPPFPLLPVNHVEVPGQHIDLQMSPSNQQRMEEFAQPVGKPVRVSVDQHADPTVEIPAKNDDVMAGLDCSGAERPEIGIPVDEKRCTLGVLDSPTIAS
ncbi:MAG TPA: hypothetical protein VFB99_07595, partial [Vicinamibacterales bacterium]|nr:hypothetical protein [Vicinamibacterales bacterium]